MRYLFCSCLASLLLAASASAGNPAGTVLYCRFGGEVLLLLADHAETGDEGRGWAAFGGNAEPGESTAETAARETEEETRGQYSREMILDRIGDTPPLFDGAFAYYFVEVPFIRAETIAARNRDHPNPSVRERANFAWIPYSAIRTAVVSGTQPSTFRLPAEYVPEGSGQTWLWDVWVGNMRAAYRKKAIPWETEYAESPALVPMAVNE